MDMHLMHTHERARAARANLPVNGGCQEGQVRKMRSQWDISFPQAMLWGILGCVAGFAISIARERTLGTLVRLEAAPITWFHILSGKALACFLTAIGVVTMMTDDSADSLPAASRAATV